jgi:hypothetical protein
VAIFVGRLWSRSNKDSLPFSLAIMAECLNSDFSLPPLRRKEARGREIVERAQRAAGKQV